VISVVDILDTLVVRQSASRRRNATYWRSRTLRSPVQRAKKHLEKASVKAYILALILSASLPNAARPSRQSQSARKAKRLHGSALWAASHPTIKPSSSLGLGITVDGQARAVSKTAPPPTHHGNEHGRPPDAPAFRYSARCCNCPILEQWRSVRQCRHLAPKEQSGRRAHLPGNGNDFCQVFFRHVVQFGAVVFGNDEGVAS
jgi:hypothetical protein